MKSPVIIVLALAALVAAALLAGRTPALAQQELPAGHPPVAPTLPPGHPTLDLPAGHPPISGAPEGPLAPPTAPGDPADVASADSIISAYYETVSGQKGQERDWDRFRSLFIPEARLIAAQPLADGAPCVVLTPEQFIRMNTVYFASGGYFERDVHRRVDRFGNMALVLSTYESRRELDDAEAYSRGINSFQLAFDGRRWWIATVMWDYERPENPIPPERLTELHGER